MRYQQPSPDEIDPAELDDHDFVVRRNAAFHSSAVADGLASGRDAADAGPYWGALLTSPVFAAAVARMGVLVRESGERPNSYSHADREFVDLVLSRDLGTDVVLPLHIPDALAAGVRLEAVLAVRQGREEDLTPGERLRARYIRAVAGGTLDDDLVAEMQAEIGVRPTLEYTVFVLWLQFTIRLMQAVGVGEPPPGEIDRLIDRLAAGDLPVPGFTPRTGVPR